MCDFGAGGTSVTLSNAGSDFEQIGASRRYPEFSGDGKYLFFVSERDFSPIYSATEWNHAYADLARIAPYAVTVQIKTEIQRAGAQREEADMKRLIGILHAANYRGYVALEYEAAEDPKVGVPRALQALRPLCAG